MVRPELIRVPEARGRQEGVNPAVPLVYSFAALIVLGTAVLMLPVSTASGATPPLPIALFTATSAATVTGLVVLDTGTYWSPIGHVSSGGSGRSRSFWPWRPRSEPPAIDWRGSK